jgi:opacity protein-like surface antigen
MSFKSMLQFHQVISIIHSWRRLPFVKVVILSLFFIVYTNTSSAQIIWAGLKAGAQMNFAKIDASSFKDTVRINPVGGFNVGAALLFKVRDRYFLHTEYIYSTKSKVLTGKVDPDLKDKLTYQYVEIPILFTMQFKGHLGKGKEFKYYLGAGPNVAYVLGGRGTITSGELHENNMNSLSYKIKFGSRPDHEHPDYIYYNSANRFQFGINVGAGILIEPAPKHKMILDVRYTFDQTLFGKKSADYLIPHDYSDNLRFRNRLVKVSVLYLLQYNLSKKERNKGKSNIKSRM